MSFYWYVIVIALAGLVTFVTTPFVIKLATHYNIIDYPDGRRINDVPTPRPGGIALYVGIAVSLAVFALLFSFSNTQIRFGFTSDINYFGVALAATVVFGVGLVDDVRSLKPLTKFLWQIVAATIACLSGALFSRIDIPMLREITPLGFLSYPITIFYLVAFANIINLIDGIDGLAAGITTISAVTLFIVSLQKGGYDAALLAMALIGACVAFLWYNKNPARIFMGDSGAYLLGFSLGLVSLFGLVRTPALITMAVPVVIAGIPVLDTFSAIIRRIRAGSAVGDADVEHIHHRMLEIGLSQKRILFILCGLTALTSGCALLLTQFTGWVRWATLAVLLVVAFVIVNRLRLMNPVLRHYYAKKAETAEFKAVMATGQFQAVGDTENKQESYDAVADLFED